MKEQDIVEVLQTVYDPEVPILDIYSMWLIYKISIDWDSIHILMTFTSPACPMWDMIIQMVKNSINEKYPQLRVEVEISFEPAREISMIKNEDIREIFEWEF